jgi:hypothetical protein
LRNAAISLMKKDLLVMKHEKKSLISWAILLLMSPLFTVAGNPFFALLFCAIPVLSWCSLLFGYDEKCGGDRFMASLPVTRAEIVRARYYSAVLAGLAALGIMYGANPLMALAQRGLEGPVVSLFARIGVAQAAATRYITPPTGFYVVAYLAFFALYVGVMFPLCYKMGLVKSRNYTILFMMLPAIVGGMLIGMDQLDPGTRNVALSMISFFAAPLPAPAVAAAVAACAAVLAASALLSVRIFRAKEL